MKADISPAILKDQLAFGGKTIVKEREGFSCNGIHLAVEVTWVLSLSCI